MTDSTATATSFTGRTAWARNLEEPVRVFLRTETGGAAILLAASVAALVWVNIDAASYARVWNTSLSIRIGGGGVSETLRQWINNGLMAFFFLAVGLEARREFDLGELRDRRRLILPAAAALGGMLLPVAIFLAFNLGHGTAHGWGTAMSTDTAFALGMLALVGRRFPQSLRTYILTVAVADDIASFVVIAIVYSHSIRVIPLLVGAGVLALVLPLRMARVRNGVFYLGVGLVAWVALLKSGVDPVIVRGGHWPPLDRLPSRPRGPGARDRPVPALPRTAHIRGRANGAGRCADRDLPQRTPAADLPPDLELRGGSPVRPRQRGHRHHRALSLAGLQLARSPWESSSATSWVSRSGSGA